MGSESLYIKCQVALTIGYPWVHTDLFFFNRHVDSNIFNKDENNDTIKSKYTENSSP